MNCLIRNARIEDYESVVQIINQVQQMHIAWRPDIYRANDLMIPRDAFEKLVAGDTLFVAVVDGAVVGVLEIVYRHVESPAHVTRNILYIETMAVDEPYRGKGIGHMFFAKAKEIKEKLHFDAIELQVNAKNKAAYEMYTNYGFTEKSINMELLFPE